MASVLTQRDPVSITLYPKTLKAQEHDSLPERPQMIWLGLHLTKGPELDSINHNIYVGDFIH